MESTYNEKPMYHGGWSGICRCKYDSDGKASNISAHICSRPGDSSQPPQNSLLEIATTFDASAASALFKPIAMYEGFRRTTRVILLNVDISCSMWSKSTLSAPDGELNAPERPSGTTMIQLMLSTLPTMHIRVDCFHSTFGAGPEVSYFCCRWQRSSLTYQTKKYFRLLSRNLFLYRHSGFGQDFIREPASSDTSTLRLGSSTHMAMTLPGPTLLYQLSS